MSLSSVIEQVLRENKIFKKGFIVNGVAESGNNVYPSAEILGEPKDGECLIVFLEDDSIIVIPLESDSISNIDNLLNYRKRRDFPEHLKVKYNYCLIYSYIDLTKTPPNPTNPNSLYGVRKDRRLTYSPEALSTVPIFNQGELEDNNIYKIPIRRYPYFESKEQAVYEENYSFKTPDILPSFSYIVGEDLVFNKFENKLVRDMYYTVALILHTRQEATIGLNPWLPPPIQWVYEWHVKVNMTNIRSDDYKIGAKIVRFKYSDKYEIELIKLHPYEIYKTYINQIGRDEFEVVVKYGIYIDYNGFPNNQYNIQEWYDKVKNEDYINFPDNEYQKSEQLAEFTWEQIFLFKWYEAKYFIIKKGNIIKEHIYTPTDDYRNFDFSNFKKKGSGKYDKVYACAAAGNWDKYDKDGNQLIEKNYYEEPLEYKNHFYVDLDKNLNNPDFYSDEDGKLDTSFKDIPENNTRYIVQPYNIAWEWSNLYTFPNSTSIKENIPIKKIYENLEKDDKNYPLMNVHYNGDYGQNTLNSIEKNILGTKPYQNIIKHGNKEVYPLIFSNLHNNIIYRTSAYDYALNDLLEYYPDVSIFEKSFYTQIFKQVTMDYFPEESTGKIEYFDSLKKPWQHDYPETIEEDNLDQFAKIEFKLLNAKSNKEIYQHKKPLIIHKFDITQKDVSNVTSRGEVDLEKFHIKNIYIVKNET